MTLTVKETFEEYSDLSPSDTGLSKRIMSFEQYFLNKNPNHTEFFGGNLIGTPSIRWSPQDTKKWLEEVCLLDDIRNCQRDLYECRGINKDFNVSSDIFNLSIPWVLNILWRQNKTINNRPDMVAALVVGMAYHLSTFMFRRFEYPANPSIALSMFEHLDNKSDFKRYGSWVALLRERTSIFLDTEGRYPDVWQEMTNDDRTVRMCNEVNGNIRVTVNILTEKYYIEKDNHNRVISVSKLGQIDGETVIKDYVRKSETLKADMGRICKDPNSLIKEEILDVLAEIVTTANPRSVKDVLNYLSDNYRGKGDWHLWVERLVIFLLELSRTRDVSFKDIGAVVNKTITMFSSSSTTNKDVVFIKSEVTKLCKTALPGERANRIPPNIKAVITYMTIRILSINYYA